MADAPESSKNEVAERAMKYRNERGHWGLHAEALYVEVQRLYGQIAGYKLNTEMWAGQVIELRESLQANIAVSKARDAEVQRLRAALQEIARYPDLPQIARLALSGKPPSSVETKQEPDWRALLADCVDELKKHRFNDFGYDAPSKAESAALTALRPYLASSAVETSDSGLAEVRDRSANVALTCSGACRYRNGAFIADPACDTHGAQVKASAPRCDGKVEGLTFTHPAPHAAAAPLVTGGRMFIGPPGSRVCPKCGEELDEKGHHKPYPVEPLV